MIVELITEAVVAGARRAKACELLGLAVRTVERWAHSCGDERRGPKSKPRSALGEEERCKVVKAATSPEFRGLSPKQIVPTLADRGEYVASESTFYRVLKAESMDKHRSRQRPASKRPREHKAIGPWQVMSWDITYMKSPIAGIYYYLYMFIDVWSRKVVGWAVHNSESADHSAALVREIAKSAPDDVDLNGIVLHSDNGGPMKGATMLATLESLGVIKSFSRPHVSDDNPFSEALFRTLKYVPEYPRRFASIEHAREWVDAFVQWYNNEHLHCGIGYVAPATRHSGRDIAVLENRRKVYEAARRRHPERWSGKTRKWGRPATVVLNPADGKARVDKAA